MVSRWEVRMAVVRTPAAHTGTGAEQYELDAALREGDWEPFMVTDNLGGPYVVYHLRRRVITATVVTDPNQATPDYPQTGVI